MIGWSALSLVVRRAEIAQPAVRLADDALLARPRSGATCRSPVRPTAGRPGPRRALACSHRRNSSSISSSRPTSGVACERSASNRLATPLSPSTCQAWVGAGETLQVLRAEVAQLEQIADLPTGRGGDDDRVGLGQRLQPRREVRRLADHRLLLRRAGADQVADDGKPGGDADAQPQAAARSPRRGDRIDQREAGADRPFGVVLMRLAGSRNRRARRRPCIWRQSRRSRPSTSPTQRW